MKSKKYNKLVSKTNKQKNRLTGIENNRLTGIENKVVVTSSGREAGRNK